MDESCAISPMAFLLLDNILHKITPTVKKENTSSDTVQPPLPRLDLPVSDFSENREESQTAESLCTDGTALEAPDAQNAQRTPYASGTHKSTHENFGKPAKSFSDFYL